jgi:hypothetical protein
MWLSGALTLLFSVPVRGAIYTSIGAMPNSHALSYDYIIVGGKFLCGSVIAAIAHIVSNLLRRYGRAGRGKPIEQGKLCLEGVGCRSGGLVSADTIELIQYKHLTCRPGTSTIWTYKYHSWRRRLHYSTQSKPDFNSNTFSL